MTTRLDRLIRNASIAVTAGLVLAVAATASYIAFPSVANATGAQPAPRPVAYAVGDPIDVPAGWYEGATRTLIVFARASCAACDSAKPFLTELVADASKAGRAVMAHPPGEDAADRAYARDLGVADADIRVVTPGLRVRATPTLVLVDARGTILQAWEGVGPAENHPAIAAALAAALR
jgi:hypothetical protein